MMVHNKSHIYVEVECTWSGLFLERIGGVVRCVGVAYVRGALNAMRLTMMAMMMRSCSEVPQSLMLMLDEYCGAMEGMHDDGHVFLCVLP